MSVGRSGGVSENDEMRERQEEVWSKSEKTKRKKEGGRTLLYKKEINERETEKEVEFCSKRKGAMEAQPKGTHGTRYI